MIQQEMKIQQQRVPILLQLKYCVRILMLRSRPRLARPFLKQWVTVLNLDNLRNKLKELKGRGEKPASADKVEHAKLAKSLHEKITAKK